MMIACPDSNIRKFLGILAIGCLSFSILLMVFLK